MISMLPLLLVCRFAAQCDEFSAPGYAHPVVGAWYTSDARAASAMPLGALGTGYVGLESDGTFGEAVMENNWLEPQQVNGDCGWTIEAGDKKVSLFPGSDALNGLRFWGHYPMADYEFGAALPVRVYARAFSPLIPHDYEKSALPVALFRYYVENTGGAPMPVKLQLQWRRAAGGADISGNVEGALGWNLDTLAPGQMWTVAPTIVFLPDRTQLAQRLAEARVPMTVLAGQKGEVNDIYNFGGVTDFYLDHAGGFNWEDQRQHSATYAGAPQIGQIFWDFSCDGFSAGRGMKKAYGLAGGALPAWTENGKVEVGLRVSKAGQDAVTLAYSFKNLSHEPLNGLRFGFSVNADLGGAVKANDQRAEPIKDLRALVFSDPKLSSLLAITGDAATYALAAWPGAHELMARGEMKAFDAPEPVVEVRSFPDGIQIGDSRGTYAVGAAGDGWSIQSINPKENLITATASRTIAPGEKNAVSFGLAWHFPRWTSTDGERLCHKYAMGNNDAGEVLARVILDAAAIETAIVDWQDKIYAAGVPGLLKDAVINGLYIWPKNSWWLDDGRFLQNESFTGCPITETFVCRFNGSFPLALMFPECEKSTMRAIASAQAESGEIPFAFGSPAASRSPYFHVQHPIVSPEFVLVTARNYDLWKQTDPEGAADYLARMYPHVQKAMKFARTLDKDKDGLVNEDPGSAKGFPANQYYDIWPWWGTSAYTGSIWLAAVKAAGSMARVQGDSAYEQEMAALHKRGAESFEKLLWTGSYYRLYNAPAKKMISQTCLTNQLCGQWFAYAAGLGEILPKDHVDAAIDSVLKLNVPATAYGAANGVKPDGKPDESFPDHSAVVTIGEVWNFCAMAAFAGRTEDAMKLFNTSYENILVNQRTPWNIPWSLDRKTGEIKWGVNYYSNPCVWTLFQALAPDAYRGLGAKIN